ncbi:elongation factor G [Feifania hominis]|uniref:Elongation factor G n=1 Tax=Feifania hominis TaxID=2763660 RepID=A0A926DGP6_9FIRM|nr:elongation factor G [Feifania hominis]MBC8536969.1 elongation factor G [Feifania hominis]
MKPYPVKNLRNVCLLGRGGDGKSTLVEAALFLTKATDRLGKAADGNLVCDFDPEEVKRKISISTAVAPVEYKGCKINFIDTPGYYDFVGEVEQGARVAETALIVISAKAGVGVSAEKAWKVAMDAKLSKLVFVSKVDEENAHFYHALEKLHEKFGVSICPVMIPIIEEEKVVGYVDLLSLKAKKYKDGVPSEVPVPEAMNKKIEELTNMINEAVAETSEELMEKFFSGEPFTREEIVKGFKAGVLDGSITPVVCGISTKMEGVSNVLDMLVEYYPSPDERASEKVLDKAGSETELKMDESGPLAALVFKTVADPFVGKMSYFKVFSGVMKPDSSVVNTRTGQNEKIGRCYFVRGKKQVEAPQVGVGDIGVVTKLAGTATGDTLCAPGHEITLHGIDFPKPCLTMAIIPKAKGDEEKISSGVQRLLEEDPTLGFVTDKETKQQLISGMGDVHLDVIVSKLKSKFGTSVDLEEPITAYRETIRKKVKVEGKHKKQSGGHGQFGHVWIEFEPCPESEELVFEEKVFGGAVPKNFFPAVEKGLRDCVKAGVLAAYPVVNLKATLVDGSYHPVDSSEMAFKVAAGLAFKNGLPNAGPVLLEPIGHLKAYVPDKNMGDVIGDINKRRGRILGMNPAHDGLQEVEAEVPMAEMHSYATDLRSITKARGYFELAFERYEEAPPNVAQKVVEERKKLLEAE